MKPKRKKMKKQSHFFFTPSVQKPPPSLLLPKLYHLNPEATKRVWVGLHIHDGDNYRPIIHLTCNTGGWVALDPAAWRDFHSRFMDIVYYFKKNRKEKFPSYAIQLHGLHEPEGEEEEEEPIADTSDEKSLHFPSSHTVVKCDRYILKYEEYCDQPVVVIQKERRHDIECVWTGNPFFIRLTAQEFDTLRSAELSIRLHTAWLKRVSSDVETCRTTLIRAIASEIPKISKARLRRKILARKEKIRARVCQKMKLSSADCELPANYKKAVTDDLLEHHFHYMVKNVVNTY